MPLVGGIWASRAEAQQHPLIAFLICVGYEIAVLGFTFGRKVWAKVEDRAVQSTADWLLAAIRSFAPGFRRRYKQQIIIDHGIFNVRGLGLINTFTLELEQVFVDLKIAPSNNPQRASSDPLGAKHLKGNRPIWDFMQASSSTTKSHSSISRRARGKESKPEGNPALAIIGPPGSGKTTLLQHVALTLAANRQRRYRVPAHIPILLFLRDHVATIVQHRSLTLGALVQDYYSDSNFFPKLNPPLGWFEKQLEGGRCIVLLDGLDEVAELQQRKTISAWVDNQIKTYKDCHFVITARPQGYRGATLERADVLEVQPFSALQVRKSIENWYLANEIKSSGNQNDPAVRQRAIKDANSLLHRLNGLPALSVLTVNPLLLTMIAMVHRYHGTLPGSRVELYAEICEVLLGRWRQARGIKDSLNAAQKLVVLCPLSSYMMEQRRRDITTAEAMTLILPLLQRVGITDEASENFLLDLQGNSGLLLEREADHWSFAHQTFQEYLAAAYWQKQDSSISRNWHTLVGDSWWHETLRLYAAQGDATPIVRACLDVHNVPALTLAADCLEEAREIEPELREETLDRLIAGLESLDPNRRSLAAEVQLSRRLRSLQRIDDEHEIDLEYLSCAEYQLFLDDMRVQGEYDQPDHWTHFSFPVDQARSPVGGIRRNDALAFCQWLTQRQGGSAVYRLPRPEDVAQYPNKSMSLAVWCKGNEFDLVGLSPSIQQSINNKMLKLATSGLPLPSLDTLNLDLGDIRDLSTYQTSRGIHGRVLAFDHALMLVLGLDEAIFQAEAHSRDKVANAVANALGCIRSIALRIDRSETLDLDSLNRSAYTLTASIIRLCQLDTRNRSTEHNGTPDVQEIIRNLQSNSDIRSARLGTLLEEALLAADAKIQSVARQRRRAYVARILEYLYVGLGELKGYIPTSWFLPLKPKNKISDLQNLRQITLIMYWWTVIALARESGQLCIWEGIRIVREHTPLAEQ